MLHRVDLYLSRMHGKQTLCYKKSIQVYLIQMTEHTQVTSSGLC